MYESHFGLSELPFKLSADPRFYFDAVGNRDTCAAFHRAIEGTLRVVMLSGGIGTGKTTLARAAFARLDPSTTSLVHIVSSQLDARELMMAVLRSLCPIEAEKPLVDLRASLRAFLGGQAVQGRCVLLAIDEAQCLTPDALAALDLLLAEAPESSLRVCLIGQPELRDHVMAVTALRLDAKCHLDALDAADVAEYVKYRLGVAGWAGYPRFSSDAFAAIHRWTSGIPRRINLLCNRVLLELCLLGETIVTCASVRRAAQLLQKEIGGFQASMIERGPILCVVGSESDCVKAVPLIEALLRETDIPIRLAHVGDVEAWWAGRSQFGFLKDLSHFGVPADLEDNLLLEELTREIEDAAPQAIVVFASGRVAQIAACAAQDCGVTLVQVDGGLGDDGLSAASARQPGFIEKIADVIYTSGDDAVKRLSTYGIPAAWVHNVGSLSAEAFQVTCRSPLSEKETAELSFTSEHPFEGGYALVALAQPENIGNLPTHIKLVSLLRRVSHRMPLIWLISAAAAQHLIQPTGHESIEGERVRFAKGMTDEQTAKLMTSAVCVITDSEVVQEQTTAICKPCITVGHRVGRRLTYDLGSNTYSGLNEAVAERVVWECRFNGGKTGESPPLWDADVGKRIATHLVAWLTENALPDG